MNQLHFSNRTKQSTYANCHLISKMNCICLQRWIVSEFKGEPPAGLEPAILGLGGRCLIHWATEATHILVLDEYEIARSCKETRHSQWTWYGKNHIRNNSNCHCSYYGIIELKKQEKHTILLSRSDKICVWKLDNHQFTEISQFS